MAIDHQRTIPRKMVRPVKCTEHQTRILSSTITTTLVKVDEGISIQCHAGKWLPMSKNVMAELHGLWNGAR